MKRLGSLQSVLRPNYMLYPPYHPYQQPGTSGAPSGGPPTTFNTPINAHSYFNIGAPSSNQADPRTLIQLQMSAMPQMSEIPREERVQYAY